MKLKSKGIFTPKEARTEHKFSPRLANALLTVIPANRPVYDFGCGKGDYIRHLEQQGMRVFGYEGTPDMAELVGWNGIKQADITEPINVKKQGTVLCLEVLEHIEPEFTDSAISNLVNACSGRMVVSWALKGQGGCGHVNEQNEEWVIERFEREGFVLNGLASERLRKAGGSDLWWFKKSIYVFDKVKK